jgi:signal transduction histidine kinase
MRIINGCKFGAETVKRLQGFAGVSPQKDHPVEILDLSEIITQAVEITKPFWKNAPEKEGIQVDLRLHLREGCFILGKKHELFEVLVNLIKNAVEAMPNGGNLDITCDLETKNICIKVRDSGMGVSPENLGKLFTPFFTTKLASGSGLGLATTRKIISDHNGHIFVTSESGLGALFTIILPTSKTIKPSEKR